MRRPGARRGRPPSKGWAGEGRDGEGWNGEALCTFVWVTAQREDARALARLSRRRGWGCHIRLRPARQQLRPGPGGPEWCFLGARWVVLITGLTEAELARLEAAVSS